MPLERGYQLGEEESKAAASGATAFFDLVSMNSGGECEAALRCYPESGTWGGLAICKTGRTGRSCQHRQDRIGRTRDMGAGRQDLQGLGYWPGPARAVGLAGTAQGEPEASPPNGQVVRYPR